MPGSHYYFKFGATNLELHQGALDYFVASAGVSTVDTFHYQLGLALHSSVTWWAMNDIEVAVQPVNQWIFVGLNFALHGPVSQRTYIHARGQEDYGQ